MPDSGATAWILASSALVLLMTPGLALFYGGMVRTKSVLNMMMMSFGSIAVVSVLWTLFGYSLTFVGDQWNGLLGTFDGFGLRGMLTSGPDGGIPDTVFIVFQLMFAIITAALISGAIADRAKFGSWLVFVALWVTLVYFPVAHWVFFFGSADSTEDGGLIAEGIKAFDFAGGTAVHVNAGAAALALAIVLGRRKGWPKERFKPHNVPMVLLGAGLLWFGWFGFNAGSAVGANDLAGVAFLNTQVCTATAVLGWIIIEWIRDGKPTALGAASGAIAGLVAITPACATITPIGAILLGLVAGALCALAVGLKYKLRIDDSLDVVGIHFVGGAVGALSIGFLANGFVPGTGFVDGMPGTGVNGLLYGGDASQLGRQAAAVGIVAVYSFVVSLILGFLIEKTIGFRVREDAEIEGVDSAEHAESAYDMAPSTASGSGFAMAGITPGASPAADVPATEKVAG